MENNIKETTLPYPYLQKPLKIYQRQNGHTIVIAYKEGILANVSTWVKTGSINETDDNNGISHFLEHLMFKGTSKHKAGEFDRLTESKGGIVNAATWKDYTYYYITLPKGPEDSYLKSAIELHADMMLDPVIPQCEIGDTFDIKTAVSGPKRERHVVTEEIGMRDDQPWTKVYNLANKNMYTNHPYKRDVIGTAELIAGMPRETVLEYYRTYYTPANMTTIICGDFDCEEILNLVVNAFDFKGRKNGTKKTFKHDKPVTALTTVEEKAKITTGFLTAGWLGPDAADLKNAITADMITLILGDGQSSRLYQNLIEKQKKQIFNIVAADFYGFKDGGNFLIEANFDKKHKDKAIQLIKDEIEKLIKEPISDGEYKKVKKKLKATFAATSETVSDIAETIGYYLTVCENADLINSYLNTLESITKEDIQNAAKEYLDLNKAVFAILLPE